MAIYSASHQKGAGGGSPLTANSNAINSKNHPLAKFHQEIIAKFLNLSIIINFYSKKRKKIKFKEDLTSNNGGMALTLVANGREQKEMSLRTNYNLLKCH